MLQVFLFLTGSCGNIRFKNYNLFSDYAEYFWKVAKVEFMKMSTPQEKAQCVSWFIETKSVILAQRNFTHKYGRKPPARSTIRARHEKFMETGSVFRERKLADLKYQKKKLNLCEWHIPEALESLFAGLLPKCRSHAPRFTNFCIEICDLAYTVKRSYCKPLSQKISHDEKNLQ